MGWVLAAAVVCGIAAYLIADDLNAQEQHAWRIASHEHSARILEVGTARAGPAPEFDPPALVRWPWLTGVGAFAVAAAVGSLVVIALNSERRDR